VYAEIRFAPSLHLQRGMSRREVIEAVAAGLGEGERATGMPARVIVDAMRHESDSLEVAEAAAEFAGRIVVGFDLAGPEAGYPASLHRPALEQAREAGLRLTIHAGEADGPSSIADALDCGAERLGHGVRVVDDVAFRDGEIVDLGPVARRVHREGIPLEVCPSSNVHTRAVPSIDAHPAAALLRAGFAVTLNTDNRLMSRTSMTHEFEIAQQELGMSFGDLHAVTRQAVEAAFCDEATRSTAAERIDAGYEAA
jgi:adenosine deaminase